MSIIWHTYNWEGLSKKMLYEALTLRSLVFVVEQNCVYQDLDSKDENGIHVLGYKQNLLVAYARVFPNAKPASIGRVVIHPLFRGLGIWQACYAKMHQTNTGKYNGPHFCSRTLKGVL